MTTVSVWAGRFAYASLTVTRAVLRESEMMQKSKEMLDMEWETPEGGFPIPFAEGGVREAVFLWKKNMPGLVWNTLASFENNPSTLPQTETILQGYTVGGLKIDDMMQVKRFGDACRKLAAMIDDGTFRLDATTACALHEIVGQEEALEWGVLRKRGELGIRFVDYTPPRGELIPALAERGFPFLSRIENSKERAFITFLWCARTQLFYDCNKRTALLMLNGILLSTGYLSFGILNTEREYFNKYLRDFYDTGNATKILSFFSETCQKIYPQRSINSRKEQPGEATVPSL